MSCLIFHEEFFSLYQDNCVAFFIAIIIYQSLPELAIMSAEDKRASSKESMFFSDETVQSITTKENGCKSNPDIKSVADGPMTYTKTKKSTYYVKAKCHLQAGDFEAALSSIELGITSALSLLSEQDELHESIAPLYYLYGTTLLYSIEESQENPENQLMAAQQQETEQDNDGGAGDLQIAWENLETARNVLSRMCADEEIKEELREELVMDLAQIHGRLGDLSRHDGHYERAINDYELCCESRRNVLTGDKVWDRKIADVEYSLGMTCLSLAAEGEKNLVDALEEDDKGDAGETKSAQSAAVVSLANAVAPPKDDDLKVKLSPERITALREKSYRHYVQCSRILAGIIAIMCSQNPTETAAADSNLEHIENKKMKSADLKNGGGKTTGLDENRSVQEMASDALSILRKRVSVMKCDDADDNAKVHDIREMLDEIQETIDTSEKDREGLRDISLMRKKAEEDVKNNDETVNTKETESGITTIGFGQTSDAKQTVTIGFAAQDASLEPTKKPAAPMMVVKKKKKKDHSQVEKADAKRMKT